LCVVWLSWGLSYPVTAVVLRGFDIVTCRVLVQVLGAGTLLLQAVLFGRSLRVRREVWRDLVIAGLLNMTIMPLGMNLGVYLAGPGRTAILVYTMPIWASVFARPLLGEKLTGNRIAALVLGSGAVIALISQDLSHLAHAPAGVAAALVTAMAYGLGTVWLKRCDWRADPSVVAFWQLAVGTVPIACLWTVVRFPPDLTRPDPTQWLALGFIGLVGNGIAYFAWFRLVRRLPAVVLGLSNLFVPCIGVVSSALLLGEVIAPSDVAAMALIGAALLLVLGERLRIGGRRGAAIRDPSPQSDPGTG